MFRITRRRLCIPMALVVCLALVNPVRAGSVPHKESSTGQITSITATEMTWVAVGHGTHVGRYSEEGSHFYFDDGTLNGVFTITAADGSTISGIYYGTYSDLGGGYTGFDVVVEWLEGEGRLAGITGLGSASAVMENATGIVEIEAVGIWNKP